MRGVRQQWRQWRLLFLLALATAVAACKADTPPLSGKDGTVGDECMPYADQLVAYTPAEGGNPEDGQRALGAPDDQSVTIDTDDLLTIGFVGLGGVEDSDEDGGPPGPDIRVHGTAIDGTEVDAFMSVDGETWETAGTVGNVEEADLDLDIADTASLSLVVYVQLVGVTGELAVDAFESLQTTCTTSVR
jgi:hypothetical protein